MIIQTKVLNPMEQGNPGFSIGWDTPPYRPVLTLEIRGVLRHPDQDT